MGRGMYGDEFARDLMYRKHREHVLNARSKIDMKPSQVYTKSFMNLAKMKIDNNTFQHLNTQNHALLRKCNSIQITSGFTDNYNTFSGVKTLNMNFSCERLKNIERENYKMGCNLLQVKSRMDTRNGLAAYHDIQKRRLSFDVSQQTLNRYRGVVMPQDAAMLHRLLRPKIFFDLEVENIRPLGRIIIQLFTEACPEVVLEFVRMCTHRTLDVFKFIRIFPHLWIEGELAVEGSTLNYPNFDYDMGVLDHGFGPGVFSFAKCYLDGFKHGLINFSISFKPLSVLNGERVPFALVSSGLRVLDCLQDYGTKNGKTQKNIVVVNCGMYS